MSRRRARAAERPGCATPQLAACKRGALVARVLVYQTLADKHDSAAAKAMKCSPYAVKDYARAAQSYSPAKVERIFGYLREADKKAKGRGNATISDGMLLREAVFKILH